MSDAKECAKAIRKELKTLYPNIKFNVTSVSYSTRDVVRIKCNDVRLCTSTVLQQLAKYEYGEFDSTQDIYNYKADDKNIPYRVKFITIKIENHIRYIRKNN